VLTVFVFKRHLLARARPSLAALMGMCAALHVVCIGEQPHCLTAPVMPAIVRVGLFAALALTGG
jgi:hypothetical protein